MKVSRQLTLSPFIGHPRAFIGPAWGKLIHIILASNASSVVTAPGNYGPLPEHKNDVRAPTFNRSLKAASYSDTHQRTPKYFDE